MRVTPYKQLLINPELENMQPASPMVVIDGGDPNMSRTRTMQIGKVQHR